LKAAYKAANGKDWKPAAAAAQASQPAKPAPAPKQESKESSPVADQLNDDIAAQGDKVRQLKAEKADKVAVDTAVNVLLGLKTKYKTVTGNDWKPPAGNPAPKAAKKPQQPKEEGKAKGQKQEKKPAAAAAAPAADSSAQKQTRLGMEAKKEECLADWYSQVITKAEMLEYYDVSGCYILRPWAYSIWERIQVINT
jgi:bifunctional glutamyl/prolyl-tRNA synthetase